MSLDREECMLNLYLSVFISLGIGLAVLALLIALYVRWRRNYDAFLERFSARQKLLAPEQRTVRLRRNSTNVNWFQRIIGLPPTALEINAEQIRRSAQSGIFFVAGVALLHWLWDGFSFALVVGIMLVTLAAIYLKLKLSYRAWLRQIDDKVPESYDMIVRSLRVGIPIGGTLKHVGEDLEGPLSVEFSRTAQQISFGKDVVLALEEMAERCDNQSLRFLATATGIQYSSGGNLAEIIERLASIARGRQQLRRKVSSITAEAQWSGRFLSVFPLIAVAGLLLINPNYFSEISDKPFFNPMLIGVGTLLCVNILFMNHMLRIE